MPLEQIVKAGKKFRKIERIRDGLNPQSNRAYQTPDEPINDLVRYGGGEVTNAQMQLMLKRSPAQTANQVNGYHLSDGLALAQAVERDYETALNHVPQKDLVELVAEGIVPKAGDAKTIKKHKNYIRLRAGDTEVFLESISNSVVRDAVKEEMDTGSESIKVLMKDTMIILRNEFLDSFKKKGKKGEYDLGKMREYLTENVRAYNEEDRKSVYVEIGKRVKGED